MRRATRPPHPVFDNRPWTATWFERVMRRSPTADEELRYKNMFDSTNLDIELGRPRPRVAYLVSGHFRKFANLKQRWIAFRNLHPQFDVYVHTWDDLGTRASNAWIDTSTSGQLQADEIRSVLRPAAMQVQSLKEMMPEFIKLRGLVGEDGQPIDLYYTWFLELEGMSFENGTDFPSCIMSQLYSIQASWKLMRDSGKNYDVVVRMRADCPPVAPAACLWLPFCEARLTDETLFFNGSDSHVHCKGGRGCLKCDEEVLRHSDSKRFKDKTKQHGRHENDVCDIFYYGNQTAMARICNLYDRVPELVKDFHVFNKTALQQNPDILKHVKYLPKLNIYTVTSGFIYENFIKCFYPERLIREHLHDMWLLSDPCKAVPWVTAK